jgi:hypothetical protein
MLHFHSEAENCGLELSIIMQTPLTGPAAAPDFYR